MAISHVNFGAAASANGGNVAPGLPASLAADDVMVMAVAADDNVACTITGWTVFGELNNGAGFRSTFAWRRFVAGDTAPTVTHTAGNSITAQIAAFRGVRTTGNPWDVAPASQADSVATPSPFTFTHPGLTATSDNNMIVLLAAIGDNNTHDAYAATSPATPTESFDSLTTLGLDSSVCCAYGLQTTAAATGSVSFHSTNAAPTNPTLANPIVLALVPVASVFPPHPVVIDTAVDRSFSF